MVNHGLANRTTWVRWTGMPCCFLYTSCQHTEMQSLQNQEIICVRQFLYTKSRARIACWNVQMLGTLSDQSTQCLAAIKTMNEKKIDLLALSETRWPGHGIAKVRSTTILHSGTPDSHVQVVHGVAIALSTAAVSSWEAANSIQIRLKTHMSFLLPSSSPYMH